MNALIALECAEMDRLFICRNIRAQSFNEALKKYGVQNICNAIQRNNKKGNKVFSVWVYLGGVKQTGIKKYSLAEIKKVNQN